MRASPPRQGAALIEALVAVVMLATTGTALITLLGQTRHSMRTVRDGERQIRDASMRLDHLVLLGRSDFLAREGRSSLAGWSLVVTQVNATLFDVSIAVSDTSAPLLGTTIYRADTSRVDR
jgi:hypothetical protein